MPAPVGTAGNVASMLTLRRVPFGLKAFAGLTHAAVSTTEAPYCFSVIFRSSHVCNSILNCARASAANSAEHKTDTAKSKIGRACVGDIMTASFRAGEYYRPRGLRVNDL